MTRIKWRRDTAAGWTAANPVLFEGEAGFETNTGKVKIGNGNSAWTALPYMGSIWSDISGKPADVDIPDAEKNVLSASKLTTTRTINGVAFDGTQNVTIPSFSRSVQSITSPTTLAAASNTDYLYISNQPSETGVVTLLHFDGTNGSTSFTDSSTASASWIPFGSATISTATPTAKFGTGRFSGGAGHGLRAAATAQMRQMLTFGTGDFTIEAWVYAENSGGVKYYWDSRPNGVKGPDGFGFCFGYEPGGGPGFGWYTNNVTTGAHQTVLINYGQFQTATGWYHLAFSRQSGTLRQFVNGSLQGTAADTRNYTCPTDMPIIGNAYSGTGSALIGNASGGIDEFRITKGTALYTAAFTAPTAAFTDPTASVTLPSLTLPVTSGNTNRYTIKNSSQLSSVLIYNNNGTVYDSISASATKEYISDGTVWNTL